MSIDPNQQDVSLIGRMSVRRRALTSDEQADLRDIDMSTPPARGLSFLKTLAALWVFFKVLRRKP